MRMIGVIVLLGILGGCWGLAASMMIDDFALSMIASILGGLAIGGIGMVIAIATGILD